MIANYHTHTPRCRHADGTEEAYVQAAIAGGLEILGFSDHTPYWFPDGYYTHMRMYPHQLPEYCDTVRQLQKKYVDQIQLHLGLEVEYYPAFFKDLLPRLRDQGIEYMILGQHWPGNEMNEPYCGRATGREEDLARYCNQVREAMETGLFTYLAHPDLLYYTGDDKTYEFHMRRLCKAAKSCNMPLEINLWGLQCGKNYPDTRFWRVAAEEGNTVVIGADAHEAWAVDNREKEAIAMEIVKQFDLPLLKTVELRKI